MIQEVEEPLKGEKVICARCGFRLRRCTPDSRSRTLALALAALVLYFPANILPVLHAQYGGMQEDSTIFKGIQGLFHQGNYMVASLIFITSIVTPGIKIVGLILLSLMLHKRRWGTFRKWIYKIIQLTHGT